MSLPHLLFVLAGHRDAECLAGDLHEEFALLRSELGDASAWRWYAWQVLRSLGRPLGLRILTVVVVVALPLALLDSLWLFVYNQLCAEPVAGLALANTLGLLGGASIVRHRAATTFLLAIGLGIGFMIGPGAFPHVISLLLSVPAGALAVQIRKAIA